MKDRVRIITDGAIITAIYALLLVASRFIGGLLEDWLYFLLPIPIAVYGYKYHIKDSLIVAVSTILISFLLINPMTTLFFVVPTMGLGIFYPVIIKADKNTIIETVFASGMALICNVLSMVFFGYLFDYDIINDTMVFVDGLLKIIANLGLNDMVITFIRSFFISLIPAAIILTSLMEGIIVEIITCLILSRLKLKEKAMFKQMLSIETIPSFVGIIYIIVFVLSIGALLVLFLDNKVLFVIASIVINVSIVYSFFMLYQGLYLVSKYTRIKGLKGIYFLAIISIFLCPFLLIFIGVFQNLSHYSLKI